MKYLLPMVVLMCFASLACEDTHIPDSNLFVNIVQQPVGGKNVKTLSCSFNTWTDWVEIADPDTIYIDARWEIYNETGPFQDQRTLAYNDSAARFYKNEPRAERIGERHTSLDVHDYST